MKGTIIDNKQEKAKFSEKLFFDTDNSEDDLLRRPNYGTIFKFRITV